tara:strand:- start:6665 stop:7900 length:1236 start_codon:yes stop_codon:yes gene_type:complete
MKLMRNILDRIKPHFEENGSLHKIYPAYDAFETFLFVPNHTTSSGTHIKDSVDLKRTMVIVIIALIPCLIFGMWNTGYQYFSQLTPYMSGYKDSYTLFDSLIYGFWKFIPLIIVSYAVGLAVEFAFAVNRKHQVNEGYLVSGMLIPLTMPIDVPLWMLALSVIFAVVVGKEVFGGTGMNILNPALTARAFIFFAYPTKMSGDKVWVSSAESIDGITGETALGQLASMVDINPTSQNIINKFGQFSSDGVYSLYNSFMGFVPGSVGETSVIAILIGAAILIFTGIGSVRIIFSMFIGGLLMAYIFNIFAPESNLFMSLNPLHQLCIGSFMFGMVFMATDPVSAAQTNTGKVVYGFLCGVLSILIRVFNPAYPEGVMVAILFMNVMAPLIDHYVIEANINRRKKRLQMKLLKS